LSDPAYPQPSSTVVLVRPGGPEPEVFMVRRHAQSAFGDAYAFPGGVIEAADHAVHRFCSGVDGRTADKHLGVHREGLSYYSAAIRELFEETGVLLADVGHLGEEPGPARDALNEGIDDWASFVTRNRLALQCDMLHYFSHWITPPSRPRRYSTRFFVAALPDGQWARHCGLELTDSCWTTARSMLDAARDGTRKLHFPTVKTLETLARHRTFDALMEWAAECVSWGVTTMVPMIIERDGQPEIVLPGDRDYPGAKS
jgi:8-oxo-dGTP pyrophosphatase MutT (NUDIX family)